MDDVQVFFQLTTLNNGFVGCNKAGHTVVWTDQAFRDFDELIAQMLRGEDKISYIKKDLFSLDTSWNEKWQQIADRAAEFCCLLFRYNVLVFRESTLFVTFPFWRKVLLQCGVKIQNIHIIFPVVHPFVHFGHLRSQHNRGVLFRPIRSYKRSVLEQINRLYYVFSNLADEKFIMIFYYTLLHEPDLCVDDLKRSLGSAEVTAVLVKDIVKEVTPYPDEINLVVKNAVADKFMEILFELSGVNRQDYLQVLNSKYGSFFRMATESGCDDAVQYYVFNGEPELSDEKLFEITMNKEENQRL